MCEYNHVMCLSEMVYLSGQDIGSINQDLIGLSGHSETNMKALVVLHNQLFNVLRKI